MAKSLKSYMHFSNNVGNHKRKSVWTLKNCKPMQGKAKYLG